MIRSIIEDRDQVRFDRAHFKEYGTYSLNFEIVYWIQNPDYTLYMDIQQAINLAICEQFKQQGIELAYPTQKLLLEKDFEASAEAIIDRTGTSQAAI
jgi:small-conductance mechanosensitive channel